MSDIMRVKLKVRRLVHDKDRRRRRQRRRQRREQRQQQQQQQQQQQEEEQQPLVDSKEESVALSLSSSLPPASPSSSSSSSSSSDSDVYGGFRIHKQQMKGALGTWYREPTLAVMEDDGISPGGGAGGGAGDYTRLHEQPAEAGKTDSKPAYYINNLLRRTYMALLILALVVAVLTYGIDVVVDLAWRGLHWINTNDDLQNGVRFLFVVSCRVAMVLLSVCLTVYVSPHAAGSGIPELRAILSGGIVLEGYLTMRTLLVKLVGLIAALGSGFPIGKEGPFIHLSCIVGQQLYNMDVFRQRTSHSKMLFSACAAGIAACFGAPIGGVLFSIEATSSFFLLSNYWSAFFCAIAGFTFVSLVNALKPSTLALFHTHLLPTTYGNLDILYAFLIGILGGLLGSLYVWTHNAVIGLRRRRQKQILGSNPVAFAAVASVIIFSVAWWKQILSFPCRQSISDLFAPVDLRTSTAGYIHDWGTGPGLEWNLLLYALYYWAASVIGIGLALPCGVFAPVFAVGASLGRLAGLVLAPGQHTLVATFAICGATAFVSGCTLTISAAVIVLELTGQQHLAVPVLVAAISSCGISSLVNMSIYDSFSELKQIPVLSHQPNFRFRKPHKTYAYHVMEKAFATLTSDMTIQQIKHILETHPNESWFPIIKGDKRTLLGEINRGALEQVCRRHPTDLKSSSLSSVSLLELPTINHSPFQITPTTALPRIYQYFHLVRPSVAWITLQSSLVGKLTEFRLIAIERGTIPLPEHPDILQSK